MFTATSTYFLMLFLILWGYCGYLLVMVIIHSLDPEVPKKEEGSESSLHLAVLVPFYNEQSLVEKKIENLKAIQYAPGRMKVYFVDGCSTDESCSKIERMIDGMPNWQIVRSGRRGKIQQINYCLELVREGTDVIICTDTDAMLSPDIFTKMVRELENRKDCAVVGANIEPGGGLPIEERYWQDQNLLRTLESRFFTSSIVVAPCYAFRSHLVHAFPEDCVADDIFVAFKANTEGFRTSYIHQATGVEVRTPRSGSEFFRHKFRKGNAYLIELFRFLYRLPYMSPWWKMIYLTKLLQLAVLPWVIPYFLLSTISMALSGGGMRQAAIFGVLFIILSFAVTSFIMRYYRSKLVRSSSGKRGGYILPFIVSNLIMIVVGLSYPFFRQNSSYKKIREEVPYHSGTSLNR